MHIIEFKMEYLLQSTIQCIPKEVCQQVESNVELLSNTKKKKQVLREKTTKPIKVTFTIYPDWEIRHIWNYYDISQLFVIFLEKQSGFCVLCWEGYFQEFNRSSWTCFFFSSGLRVRQTWFLVFEHYPLPHTFLNMIFKRDAWLFNGILF